MDFINYKHKVVISVCLLNAEKERIKEIINTYKIRLESIYNNLNSLLDDLTHINFIESMPDHKEKINKLIENVNNNNIYSKLNIDVDNEFKKIDEKNNNINEYINIYSNEYIKIKNICNNNNKIEQKTKEEIKNNPFNNSSEYEETETPEITEEEEQEKQEKEINNNIQPEINKIQTEIINNNVEINNNIDVEDEEAKKLRIKREIYNKRRREQRLEKQLKLKKEMEEKENEFNKKFIIKI
jgi:hypothetical protein